MARKDLEHLGKRILGEVRTQLYLAMHFIGAALFGLDFVMDLSTRTIGTDGVHIRFNTRYVKEQFIERENALERAYMHMLLHCLFLHPFHRADYEDDGLWDLCCDIAVESVIDDMGVPLLARVDSDVRDMWYEKLNAALSVLTAEKLYQYFTNNPPDGYAYAGLVREFTVCDHSFWARIGDDGKKEHPLPEDVKMMPMANLPLKETWERMGQQVRMEADISGSYATGERGRLTRTLTLQETKHYDYGTYLRRLARWREELSLDMDTFEPGYYHYGMEVYGNMPLIEPLEYREGKRVEQLVIAIDTSASTARHHVQRFLDETAAILGEREHFFSHTAIYIIECDDVVQKETCITKREDFLAYGKSFAVHGGYGTDFRPVFSHVEMKKKQGKLKHLKGLIYFTDGHGTYPVHATSYETSFAFLQDEAFDDTAVPAWARILYI